MLFRRVQIGLLLGLATSPAAWAASAPPTSLLRMELPLEIGAALLGVAVIALAGLEIKFSLNQREVARLAQAVEQQRVEAAEKAAAAEEEMARSAPALNPMLASRGPRAEGARSAAGAPPPPPPPAGAGAPPPPPRATAVTAPPPPFPPPALAGANASNENPFARLAALGSESSEDSVKKVVGKPSPISLPTPPPEAGSSGVTESGGWADLMNKVRTAKDTDAPGVAAPPAFGGGAAFPPPPPVASRPPDAPKAAAAGGADAWEALLKKTAAAGTESNPFAGGGGGFPPPPPPSESSSLSGLMGAPAATGAAGSNPFASLGSSPSSTPPPPPEAGGDNIPDFIKKASRTISLDANKSGEGKL